MPQLPSKTMGKSKDFIAEKYKFSRGKSTEGKISFVGETAPQKKAPGN
jgi:hypothetical protein